jgi:hypothetical protein
MAKNRKNQPAVVRFGPALKACVLCLFLGGSGVGYVGQKNQLYTLAGQFTELETRLDKLRRENAVRARNVDTLQTPLKLESRIQVMNLGLVAPQPEQIVRLHEYPAEGVWKGTARLYADQGAKQVRTE